MNQLHKNFEKLRQRWKRQRREVAAMARRISLPGFDGIPVYHVLRFFWHQIKDDRLTARAASIAFFGILALFPGIIFVFTLIPYIPVEGLRAGVLGTMEQLLPDNAYLFVEEAVSDILDQPRAGLLSIGFLLAFVFASNGVMAIQRAMRKQIVTFRQRNQWHRYIVSFKLTTVLTFLFLICVVLIILGGELMPWLAAKLNLDTWFGRLLLEASRWITIIALFLIGISTIYYFAPATERRWRFISTGSTFATLLAILFTSCFTFAVNEFNLYNQVYGSIGALMAVMLWFYLLALALIIGFELNTSIDYNRSLQEGGS